MQVLVQVASAGLGALVVAGWVTPCPLLGFTFLAGVGAALTAPAWQAVVPLTWRWKLQTGAGVDQSPSTHWPAPVVEGQVSHDRGPVMVTVEYEIDAARREEFLVALRVLEHGRRRDGAYAWFVFEDVAVPNRFVETFMVESWLEHLRQHERVTVADRDLQTAMRAYYRDDVPPRVRHLLVPEDPVGF